MSEPSKRFRVAFSVAGQKREFVEKVAAILAGRFCPETILYDKYHEAEFGRDELDTHLTRLYRDDSDLIVVVFCRDYEKKRWCGLEWKAIRGILNQGRKDRILLTRFDGVEPEILEGLAGFIDLDAKTPWKTATLILERLALNEGRPRDYYTQIAPSPLPGPWPPPFPPSTSIPHNLPTLQPFFGREEELAKIADALDPASRGWGALIDGPGGMGKTSLAVRAAYDASPAVFHQIVFVSLKTRELDDDGERDLSGLILSGLSELFGELARELGRTEIVKAAEDQRLRLLLDALRGTQALLLLDNLESLVKKERDIVFNLVKKLPTGCKAILTSRGRIGSGAEELILEKLSEPAALATLADLATHNRLLAQTSEAERLVLYRETGGKPLLLRWTAGQLGRGSCLTFTDALHFLRSCPKGNDPLEFIFGDLVADFSEAETRVLCALTYFTLPAKVEHIRDVTEPLTPDRATATGPPGMDKEERSLSAAEAKDALRSLTGRSLAVPSDEFQTFTLVPMVADFLRNKKPEIVAETACRLEARAYALLMENGHYRHTRFRYLSDAWHIIEPALPIFLRAPNERLQKVCTALKFFLEFDGRWDEALSLSKEAEQRAVDARDFFSAGWRANDAGWVHVLRQQTESAFRCAERAAQHWGGANAEPRERALAIRLRGRAHLLISEYPEAITAYDEAVRIWSGVAPDGIDLALCLEALADARRLSGQLEAAERDYLEALRIARKLQSAECMATFTGNYADLHLDRKHWPEAERWAREALKLAEGIGRKHLPASNFNRLALALVRQGKADEALVYARRAVEIYSKLGSPEVESARATLQECGSLTSGAPTASGSLGLGPAHVGLPPE